MKDSTYFKVAFGSLLLVAAGCAAASIGYKTGVSAAGIAGTGAFWSGVLTGLGATIANAAWLVKNQNKVYGG